MKIFLSFIGPKLTVPTTPEDTPPLPGTPIFSNDVPRDSLLQKDSSSETEIDTETLYFRFVMTLVRNQLIFFN